MAHRTHSYASRGGKSTGLIVGLVVVGGLLYMASKSSAAATTGTGTGTGTGNQGGGNQNAGNTNANTQAGTQANTQAANTNSNTGYQNANYTSPASGTSAASALSA